MTVSQKADFGRLSTAKYIPPHKTFIPKKENNITSNLGKMDSQMFKNAPPLAFEQSFSGGGSLFG